MFLCDPDPFSDSFPGFCSFLQEKEKMGEEEKMETEDGNQKICFLQKIGRTYCGEGKAGDGKGPCAHSLLPRALRRTHQVHAQRTAQQNEESPTLIPPTPPCLCITRDYNPPTTVSGGPSSNCLPPPNPPLKPPLPLPLSPPPRKPPGEPRPRPAGDEPPRPPSQTMLCPRTWRYKTSKARCQ